MVLQSLFLNPADDASDVPQQQEKRGNCQSYSRPSSGGMLYVFLAALCPLQHGIVAVARPCARALPRCARTGERCLTQFKLVRRVVADDPLAPERSRCIEVEHGAIPAARRSSKAWWSRIERLPSITRKVRLNPGVCVLGTHHIISAEGVEFHAAEAGHDRR